MVRLNSGVKRMCKSIGGFWNQVDEIYGTFLDSTSSYHAFRARIVELQGSRSTQVGKTIDELDTLRWIYGKGPPTNPTSQTRHIITQGELKSRLDKNGHNTLFLANLCVVAIYQYWEDHYRSKIASELGIQANDLKSDLLGDIRRIRIAIVHHGGTAKSDIEKCKVLKWFGTGDPIVIDEDRMYEIVLAIRDACAQWLALCE